MSSDEDEFFDAPNAFMSSLSKWNDSNEDLSMNTLEIVSKNAERRNRVESLRRNISINQQTQQDIPASKEEINTTKVQQISNIDSDANLNKPLLEAVIYQQKLIQQLRDDPNLCQCMKSLLNTISAAANIPIGTGDSGVYLQNMMMDQCRLSNQVTKSCPECCRPVHSLDLSNGLHSVLNNIKSWSLDSPRSSYFDKQKFFNKQLCLKEHSHTMPTDIISNKHSTITDSSCFFNSKPAATMDPKQIYSNYYPYHQSVDQSTGPTTMSPIKQHNLSPQQQQHSLCCHMRHVPQKLSYSGIQQPSAQSIVNTNLGAPGSAGNTIVRSNNEDINNPHYPQHHHHHHHRIYLESNHSQDHAQTQQSSTLSSAQVQHYSNNPSTTHINSSTLPGPIISSDPSSIPPEMNPIEIQFRERTKSMEKMLKESRQLSPFSIKLLSNSSLQKSEESERLRDNTELSQRAFQSIGGKVKKLQKNMKNAWSAVSRAKIFSQDEELSSEDEEFVGNRGIRLRSSRRMKGQRDFLQIKLVQEMKDEHTGAIWAMRFSPCGRLLATAGYDRAIRVWVLRQYYWFFKQYQKNAYRSSSSCAPSNEGAEFDMAKHTMMAEEEMSHMTTSGLRGGLDSVSLASTSISAGAKTDICGGEGSTCSSGEDDLESGSRTPFRSRPLITYRGHEGVVTDLVWSKNLFLLATSMDRQVRLWHISRRECLCIFNHNDTVPTIVFHPKDDKYFLSGSLDGKLRLWNIPDKKIRHWVEAQLPNSLPLSSLFFSTFSTSSVANTTHDNAVVHSSSATSPNPSKSGSSFHKQTGASSNTIAPSNNSSINNASGSSGNMIPPPKTVITCAAFVCEATKIAVGTYDGRVLFYTTELEYITSMAIKSTHGKNRHCRVTAIEIDPTDSHKILVTSNDSRVRLIDARDYHIICKYRGFCNFSSQIRASFSPTGKYVICGSENHFFYIWKKDVEIQRMTRFSTTRKDRNNYWEAIKAQDTVVSVCVFNPAPHLVLDRKYRRRHSMGPPSHPGQNNKDNAGLQEYNGANESSSLSPSSLLNPPTGTSSSSMILQEHATNTSTNAATTTTSTANSSYLGEVIVSADINGVIKVFKNRIHSLPVSAASVKK